MAYDTIRALLCARNTEDVLRVLAQQWLAEHMFLIKGALQAMTLL